MKTYRHPDYKWLEETAYVTGITLQQLAKVLEAAAERYNVDPGWGPIVNDLRNLAEKTRGAQKST